MSRGRRGQMTRRDKVVEIFAKIFRLAQLAFAGVVAGIVGNHLHANRGQSAWTLRRFIVAEVIAAISMLLSLLFLALWPRSSFPRWVDFILTACWFAVFGLLMNWINGACGNTFDWSAIGFRGSGNDCGTWKAAEAFTFMSAFCWLASALIGTWWASRFVDDTRWLNCNRYCGWMCCCRSGRGRGRGRDW